MNLKELRTAVIISIVAALPGCYHVCMLIGVISDTHDKLEITARALEYFATQGAELVVHCGDWKSLSAARFVAQRAADLRLPVRGVLGNNDHDVLGFLHFSHMAPGDFQLYEGVYEIELPDGKTISAYHGHHAPTLRKLRESPDIDILFLGHTHKAKIEQAGDKLIVNPGSVAFHIPRRADWQPSIALVDTDVPRAKIIYLSK